MQTKKLLAASCIALLTMATAAGADVERVGPLGAADKLMIEGAKAFSSDEIREALFNELDVIAACDPDASLTDLTTVIAEKTAAGYRGDGFCDVATSVIAGDGRLVLTIEEGERFASGEITITGNRGVDAEIIKTALPQPENIGLKARARWRPTEPASFAPEIVTQLTIQAVAAVNDQGYYRARLKATVEPDRRTTRATLRIAIDDEGPLSTLGDVEISGNERNSREAVIAHLGLDASAALTPALRDQIERRLLASGRFTQVRWELGEPDDRDDSWRPRLALQEYDLAPPLDEPLSREEAALLKGAEWFQRLEESHDEIVLRDDSGKALMVFAPQRGFIVLWNGWNDDSGSNDGPDFNLALVMDEQRVGLYSRPQRRKIVAEPPPSPVVGEASMSLVEGTIKLGAGLSNKSQKGHRRHFDGQLKLSATAALSVLRQHKASCRWDGDVLCLEWDKRQLRVNAVTGQLVEYVEKVSLDDAPTENHLRMVVRPGEFERRLRQIEEATADWPNVADSHRPLSCVAEFLCLEMGQFSAAMQRYAETHDDDDFFEGNDDPDEAELREQLRQELAATRRERHLRERLGYAALGKAISFGMLEPFDQVLCRTSQPSENGFPIPKPLFHFRAASLDELLSAARKLAPLFGVEAGNFLFPVDGSLNASWRKALLLSTKKPWNLPMSFRRERHDESGPLATLMAAEIVRASGPEFVSTMYAMHARGNLIGYSSIAAPACYREECRELASGEGFVTKCLLQVAATMRQLSPADIEALAGLLVELDLVNETYAPALELAALRARAEDSPGPAATEALLALWRAGMRSWIEQRLQQLAGVPEKPARKFDVDGDFSLPPIPRFDTDSDEPKIEAESGKAPMYK